MFVLEMSNATNSLQILPDKLAQNAGSRSVKNAHFVHAYQDSIVNEIGYGL